MKVLSFFMLIFLLASCNIEEKFYFIGHNNSIDFIAYDKQKTVINDSAFIMFNQGELMISGKQNKFRRDSIWTYTGYPFKTIKWKIYKFDSITISLPSSFEIINTKNYIFTGSRFIDNAFDQITFNKIQSDVTFQSFKQANINFINQLIKEKNKVYNWALIKLDDIEFSIVSAKANNDLTLYNYSLFFYFDDNYYVLNYLYTMEENDEMSSYYFIEIIQSLMINNQLLISPLKFTNSIEFESYK